MRSSIRALVAIPALLGLAVASSAQAAAPPQNGLFRGSTAQGGNSSMVIRVANHKVTSIQMRIGVYCPTGQRLFTDLGGPIPSGRAGPASSPASLSTRDGDFSFFQRQNPQGQTVAADGVFSRTGRSVRGTVLPVVDQAAGPGSPATLCSTPGPITYYARISTSSR